MQAFLLLLTLLASFSVYGEKSAKYTPEQILEVASQLSRVRPLDAALLLKNGIDNWQDEELESVRKACRMLVGIISEHAEENAANLTPPRCTLPTVTPSIDPENHDALLLERGAPRFPLSIMNGIIELEYTVETDGTVSEIEVLSSTHRQLRKPAITAAKKDRYKPKTENGVPVVSRVQTRYKLNVEDKK